MLKIMGIETLSKHLYRVLGSNSCVKASREPVENYILRTGELPYITPPTEPVLRKKPRMAHWCTYAKFSSPTDTHDPNNVDLHFYGYFIEPLAQDHSPLGSGEVQIMVFGKPKVVSFEKWIKI
ncbi:MAG: hypothetical protein ACE5FY_06760 [Nitrospiria bacterium]